MNQPVASLAKGHQTMLLAHRAMLRDLERTARTAERLAQHGDPARAAALRAYNEKLTSLIEHHHEGEDEFLWPKLRERDADAESLSLLATEHEELAGVVHDLRAAGRKLGDGPEAAERLRDRADALHVLLKQHAGDEERELLGSLAPAVDSQVWKNFERGMVKTAPKWTLRFMPPWLDSVAQPEEKGGVPAPPVAKLFRGWLQRRQREAFGDMG